MLDQLFPALVFATALGTALIAGIFFAFSNAIMKSLGRLPAHEGIAAMQAINVVIVNPLFLALFLGSAVAGVAIVVVALLRLDRPGAVWALAGGALYMLGSFGVTLAYNVPMNNALAALAPSGPDAAGGWDSYRSGWTAWNHVRTVASLGAAAALVVALSS